MRSSASKLLIALVMTSSAWASPPSIAHKRNAANKLYLIPQPEHDLPWFRFDSVDPVRWLAEGNVRRGTGIAGTNPPQHVAVTGDPVASPVVLSPDYRCVSPPLFVVVVHH